MRIERGPNNGPSLGGAMTVASSGMSAERFRMDIISANLANANTVAKPGEDPYRRQGVVLEAGERGVRIVSTPKDFATPLQTKYDPSHPFHDENGNITLSNVNPVMEMVDMVGASRSYEANVAAFNSARGMLKSALNIGRV